MPSTTTAVASASARPPSGPTTVAEIAPIAGSPPRGSMMCPPLSYVPLVAIAPSNISKTFKTSSGFSGLDTPIFQGPTSPSI